MLCGPHDVVAQLVGGDGHVAQALPDVGTARPGPELWQGDAELHQAFRACISKVLRVGPNSPRRMNA
jgi:hypothetical protein